MLLYPMQYSTGSTVRAEQAVRITLTPFVKNENKSATALV